MTPANFHVFSIKGTTATDMLHSMKIMGTLFQIQILNLIVCAEA